ncbi:hypothetical protein EMIT0194MI4_160083 [Pseudomonas sp. IT-194MI4]
MVEKQKTRTAKASGFFIVILKGLVPRDRRLRLHIYAPLPTTGPESPDLSTSESDSIVCR